MGRSVLWLLVAVSAALCREAQAEFVDDFNIPVTVLVPEGKENDTLRLHLAAYGAPPYGELMDKARVVHFGPNCMCGTVRCSSGCASFALAPARCKPQVPANENNVFIVEETEADEGCTRAERAYNAARFGARSLVIVAPPNATNLLARVNSQDVSAAVETLQYLEHVAMPVGVMNNKQGERLKSYAVEAQQADLVPLVKLDFQHQQRGEVVQVHVWHDTDDDCGVLCHDVHTFFADLAATVNTFTNSTPIKVVPRFIYETCTGTAASSERCKRGCVNNGKYCTLRGSRSAQAPGAMVTQENIRQACLYNALQNGGDNNVRQFWKYKINFQNNCKSADGTFGAKCSAEQFRKLTLDGAAAVQSQWDKCTAQINSGNANITLADSDLAGKAAQQVSDYLQATVVTVLPKPKNSHHYRGDLSAVHVMKAACSALLGPQRAKVPMCTRLNKGMCRPGGAGDLACATQANQEKHTTKCVDVDTDLGYTCECTPGYAEISNVDGRRTCVDRNECAEFPALCGRLVNRRNACENLEGTFRCREDLDQECSAEENWGGCWTGESNGITFHACEDLIGKARYNLQEGLAQGPLSQCNCEGIAGCWSGGTGVCRERCPLDRCNVETGQCDGGPPSLSTGGVVGLSFGIIAAAAIAAAIAYLVLRRRRRDRDPAKGVVSNYNNFRDGMDADEMARSGAVESYVAAATVGSGALTAGVVPPPNGKREGERPPTFGAQNSFVGSLTLEELEPPGAQGAR